MKTDYSITFCEGLLSMEQLKVVLEALPLDLKASPGNHPPSGGFDHNENTFISPLFIRHGGRLIFINPPAGSRISIGCFSGENVSAIKPGYVMDERMGNGACCSYRFNTTDLGLPFNVDLMLHIYKYNY